MDTTCNDERRALLVSQHTNGQGRQDVYGLDYLEVANQNGINHLSVGAPVVLADGLYGNDNIMVKAGEILGEVAVASLVHDVPAMVVCSHVKGHINAGYAGAIKNLAMGGVSASHRTCGWKCGRGSMHTIGEGELVWDENQCELCYQCRDICPMDAIEFKEGELVWEGDNCWRCGRCERVCQSESLPITMPTRARRVPEDGFSLPIYSGNPASRMHSISFSTRPLDSIFSG